MTTRKTLPPCRLPFYLLFINTLLDRLDKFIKLLQEVASDRNLWSVYRSTAQKMLEDIMLHARALLPNIIHTLAHFAENADDPDSREQAKRALSNATSQLPPASEKLQ
jgi:hypothetical protein